MRGKCLALLSLFHVLYIRSNFILQIISCIHIQYPTWMQIRQLCHIICFSNIAFLKYTVKYNRFRLLIDFSLNLSHYFYQFIILCIFLSSFASNFSLLILHLLTNSFSLSIASLLCFSFLPSDKSFNTKLERSWWSHKMDAN